MSIAASAQALARLEPYLLLAKSAKGAAAAKLIAEATAAPGCYVFAELLEFDGIRNLARDEKHGSSFRLLELFAYGTFAEYQQAPAGTYPALNDVQRDKLRHLTLVALASQSRNLPYASLIVQLGLNSGGVDRRSASDNRRFASGSTDLSAAQPIRTQAMRQLEDIIIDAIYSGIISARLDQQRQRVEVEGVMGRDVRGDEQVLHLSTALTDWQARTTSMVATLSQRIEDARRYDADKAQQRDTYDAHIERTLMSIAEAKGSTYGSGTGTAGSGANLSGSGSGHGLGLRAAYDWQGQGGDMEMDDEANALRKKKSSAAGPVRSKRSRA